MSKDKKPKGPEAVPPTGPQPTRIEQIPTERLEAMGFRTRNQMDVLQRDLNAIMGELNRREIERIKRERPAVATPPTPAPPAEGPAADPKKKP